MNEECIVDPLEFRKKILRFMRRTPRYPTEPMNNNIEGDSDVLIINITAAVAHDYVEN